MAYYVPKFGDWKVDTSWVAEARAAAGAAAGGGGIVVPPMVRPPGTVQQIPVPQRPLISPSPVSGECPPGMMLKPGVHYDCDPLGITTCSADIPDSCVPAGDGIMPLAISPDGGAPTVIVAKPSSLPWLIAGGLALFILTR